MTPAWVEEKLAVLREQRKGLQQQIAQITANLHAHDGAIQVLEEALTHQVSSQESPPQGET